MRLSFITILFISHIFCYSQKQNTDIEVEYQQFQEMRPIHSYTSSYSVLYASGDISISKSYDNTEYSQERAFNKEDAKPFDVSKKREFTDHYLKIDNQKKEMLFFDYIIKNQFLVQDIYHEFKWNITSENKIIGEYPCIKATTSYRGREWTAWFTKEIPMSFGPWKLHGLPGLILEAYDSKNEITFKAVKIEYKKNDLLRKDFKTLVKTKNKKPILYQQYLKDNEEAFENLTKQMQSENPSTGYERKKIPRMGPELEYEWEEK